MIRLGVKNVIIVMGLQILSDLYDSYSALVIIHMAVS